MAVTEASLGASRALDDLYRRHGPDVYRYALAVLGNHADAEDVTQTTFLNAYRALEQGVHPRKPVNWLLTIASNTIKQRFRQEQARPREVELDRDVATNGGEDDGPSVGEVLTALSKIPPQQRQAIVLREFEGRSYKEIAQILDVTTSALETLLFRARRSLTEELAQQLTCTEAQQAVSRAADKRLGRKEKRRLQEHLGECPDCAQFARLQQRHRNAIRSLALVPIPLSLALFKGFEGSAAAATLPVAAGSAAVGGVAGGAAAGVGTGGSAAVGGGGLFAGGLAVKAVAVVAAASVAGGVTVAGVKEIEAKNGNDSPPAATTTKDSKNANNGTVRSQRAAHASARGLEQGKAIARGQTRTAPPGFLRRNQKSAGAPARAADTLKTRASPRRTPVKPVRPTKSTGPKSSTPSTSHTPNGKAVGQTSTGKSSTSDSSSTTSTTSTSTQSNTGGASADHSNKQQR